MNARCLLVLVVVLVAAPAWAQGAVSLEARLLDEAPRGADGGDAEVSRPVALAAGPVAERRLLGWYVAVTQLVTLPPEDSREAPVFEPGLKLARAVSPLLSLGGEYVATLGTVAWLAPPGEQSHRFFAAADVDLSGRWPGCQVTLAVGYDAAGPEGWVGRLTVDFDLERLARATR